jgi:alpha-amylase
LKTWVHDIVTQYGFDGLRIDTVPEVPKDFWKEYTQSAGVYQVGEVFNGNIDYVAGYQGSLDALLHYPLYFALKNVFGYRQSMFQIRSTLDASKRAFSDVSVLGLFIDNHDNPRFLYFNPSQTLLKSAVVFTLFA